jgi:hypothetical protein
VVGAEAGFALDQALREWGGNEAARRGAEDLDALLGSRRARAAELERVAHEHDPRVSSRQRTVGLAALALVGVGLSVSSFVVDTRDVTTRSLLLQSLGPLGAVVLSAGVMRRHLLRTLLNRRMTVATIALTAFVTVNRALGLVAGVAAPQIVVSDCAGLAAVCALGAAVFFRWMAFAVPVLLAGAVAAAVWPERAVAAFSAATGVGLLVGVALVARTGSR